MTMNPKTLFRLLALVLFATIATVSAANDHYLLNCGATSSVSNTASTYDGQTWHSDDNSTFSDDFSSTISSSATSTFDAPQIPFATARIFTKNFTYSFPVSPGPKFVRLFFYPSTTYSNYSSSESFLTVQSNSGHLLLRNFSVDSNSNSSYIFKEFYVHVSCSVLQLTLSPTKSHAFLNGIEIVSVPQTLYVGVGPSPGPTSPKLVIDPDSSFYLTNATALETVYRLNVGGKDLGSKEDAGGMYRQWFRDDQYLTGDFYGVTGQDDTETTITYTSVTPNYSAPEQVYATFRSMGNHSNEFKQRMNMTWGFEVDLGFIYLLRLHWCEIVVDVFAAGYRVFDVYIHELMAEEGEDVFEWVGAYTAAHSDYVVYMEAGSGKVNRGVMEIALHPAIESNPAYYDTLLNGLEIFKINRSDGSLDAPNPSPNPSPNDHPLSTTSPTSHIVPIIVCSIAGFILLVVVIIYLLFTSRERNYFKLLTRLESSSTPSKPCRNFMLSEIKSATNDFSDAFIIGTGGFGVVYVGTLDCDHGPMKVAIKRLRPSSKQGINEFRTEITMLANLKHENLVLLIGYCDEQDEMILVYEYMQCGTLRDNLYNTSDRPLSWKQRLEVCVGVAKGLCYLHEGGKYKIIHRDIKSTNILLNESLVAKVSDFGLSKVGPMSEFDHVSTRVKGSIGYVDPEYYRTRQVTKKSDVYSFGVVLFEVLCGRPAVNMDLPKEEMNLAMWARSHQKKGSLDAIVDPNMKGQIESECLRMFGEIAEKCVQINGVDRPSMAQVLQVLENICLK